MGRIGAPFGIAGWIRVHTYTASVESLLSYTTWFVAGGPQWQAHEVQAARVKGRALVAKLKGCEDRDTAARLRGREVAVLRGEMPRPASNEWYWADLIGLKVVNVAGVELGRLARILETGSNDVLVVEGERERLIPFIEGVVREVDLAAGVMRLDWRADY
ncbi:MAG: ribosome maturation factor RimM [Betaproteobacteria bacterium]